MPRSSVAIPLLRAATRPAPRNTTTSFLCSSRIGATRHISVLPTLRPRLLLPSSSSSSSYSPNPAIFRSPAGVTTGLAPAGAATEDLVPRTAVTTHPALGGAQQVRFGPRPTLSNASRLIQKRRHGFLSRIRTAKGRKMLARRRAKGRKRLSA